MDTCFMCDQPATTAEHVPPACLFPEQKDTKGVDYRRDLITVPACASHNLKNSRDDEYLLGVIALHWRNNDVGHNQSRTKLARALRRNNRYYDLFFGQGRHQLLFWEGEALVTTDVDISRVSAELDKVARGLYFHHLTKKWLGDVDILHFSAAAIYPQAHPILDDLKRVGEFARMVCILEPRRGKNLDVFYYQVARDPTPTSTIMRLVFYGGFEVVVIFQEAL